MPTAVVRAVPASFEQALVREGRPALDVALARAQHARYVEHLAGSGYEIDQVPADDAYPDCVFVEDTAVIVGSTAVVTRPGARSRRGEVGPVAERLARRFPVVTIEAPGALDGGDVLVAGNTVYVGRSARTNDEGIRQLGAVAREEGLDLIPVEVRGVLHLKSAVLPVGEGTVVVTPNTVEEERLGSFEILYEDPSERHRFSALPLPDGTLLVTASAPRTSHRLEEIGMRTLPVDVSQIQAADGGLTCMSILF